jgi:hypothetical protein
VRDPYADRHIAFNRLYKEYQTHKKLIVALDFDDTVFDFHNEGNTYDRVFDVLFACQNLGFYIVLFTARPKEKWQEPLKYLDQFGIHVDSVNTNPFPLPFGNDGKIYYNILLDDRAGLGESLGILESVIDEIYREEHK